MTISFKFPVWILTLSKLYHYNGSNIEMYGTKIVRDLNISTAHIYRMLSLFLDKNYIIFRQQRINTAKKIFSLTPQGLKISKLCYDLVCGVEK